MQTYYWDTQLGYLKDTRQRMWNDDYFEFLVSRVWKLNRPLSIVDFGCGYGFLGMKMLPLLPLGSTYTGLDKSRTLLSEARKIFAASPFEANFIEADLTEYKPEKQYDLAICQAVLRHIPSSEWVLRKMIDSVAPGGMVICIEVNRVMEEAGRYALDREHGGIRSISELTPRWLEEAQGGGRDYELGIKVPLYMREMGLSGVGVRVNDYVELGQDGHTEPGDAASTGGESDSMDSGNGETCAALPISSKPDDAASGHGEPRGAASTGGESDTMDSGNAEPCAALPISSKPDDAASGHEEPRGAASTGGESDTMDSGNAEPCAAGFVHAPCLVISYGTKQAS